jgi:conjugal transfer/entry exclusion protein
MSSEQMQSAMKELQDAMVVMAHIEKASSEHFKELVQFRIQSEKLRLQSDEFRRRTDQNLAESTDKLNGLIGYVAGQNPTGPKAR